MPLFPGAMNLTMLHPGSAAKPRRRSSTGAGCTENELRRRAMPWEAARRGHTATTADQGGSPSNAAVPQPARRVAPLIGAGPPQPSVPAVRLGAFLSYGQRG